MCSRRFQRLTAVPAKRWGIIGLLLVLAGVALPCLGWGYITWQTHAARQALAGGQSAQAAALLRKAERLRPNRAETLFLLGRALRRSGELEAAASYLERAQKEGWPENEVRLQKQLLLTQTGAFSQAGDFLSEVLRKGVDDDTAEEIYEARAKGFYSTFRLPDALLCIEFWLKWRPHTRQARMWRAEIQERTDHWNEAVQDYRAILEHDPQDVEARLRLANALLPLNGIRDALTEYEKCLADRPDDTAAVLGRLKCLRRLGELADVGNRLAALLDRDLTPQQRGDVLKELGELALYRQEYEKAIDYLTRARQADPTSSQVHHPLSIAYSRLGMTDLAEAEKRRGEQLFEHTTQLAEITNRVVKNPRDPELRYQAGMLFIGQGLKKEGAAWLMTALECDPGHRKSHAELARYYDEIGDASAAQKHRALAGDLANGDDSVAPPHKG
jgi:tetratricopeptide (TPR) repeat protein